MTLISYAQNFEDVMLWRALKSVKEGFYIDVGAAWPEMDSVTNAFYQSGWHGINIEPNIELQSLLKKKRPRDINICMAVGENPGLMPMNFITVDDTINFGLSTLDSLTSENYIKKGYELNSIEVEVTTLSDVCKKYVPPHQEIHFLKIDVEGLEKAVLQGQDWENFRPWVVVVEATKPMTQDESYVEWESILQDAAYLLAYRDGLNRFYVSEEHKELLIFFRYPPNFFDDFVTCAQAEALQAIRTAEHLQLEIVALRRERKAVVNSLSWRLTSPLRRIKSILINLRDKYIN